MSDISRRGLLTGTACTLAASLASKSLGSLGEFAGASTVRKSKFRFVHFSDCHIQPELGATEGVHAAIDKVLSLRDRPDFVLIGGDHVMDVLSVNRERADLQFKLLAEAFKRLEMPVYSTIGNHDVYGWSTSKLADATDPLFGKKMLEEHVLKGPTYRSFDHKGWHFTILDSIQTRTKSDWYGAIDDGQLSWFKSDLEKAGDKPKVVLTHVPAMTLAPLFMDGTTKTPSSSTILENGKEVKELIQGKNVRAVLQGHTHIVENCEYLDTQYITGGAVSGDWWKGWRLGVHPEGFMVFDVDGDHLTHKYVTFGWKARS